MSDFKGTKGKWIQKKHIIESELGCDICDTCSGKATLKGYYGSVYYYVCKQCGKSKTNIN